MTWFGVFLVIYWVANALGAVALIGRKREPISPGAAVILVAIYALLVWGVVAVGTHRL